MLYLLTFVIFFVRTKSMSNFNLLFCNMYWPQLFLHFNFLLRSLLSKTKSVNILMCASNEIQIRYKTWLWNFYEFQKQPSKHYWLAKCFSFVHWINFLLDFYFTLDGYYNNFFWEFLRDEPSVCTSQRVFSHYESCYPKIISSRAFVLPIQQIFAISERTSRLADEVFDIVSTSFCNSNVQSFDAIHLFSFHPFICW